MVQSIMVSEGGTHPPEKWAGMVADQIAGLVVVDPASVSPEATAARVAKEQLRGDIAAGLTPIIAEVQAHELRQFRKHPNRYPMPYVPGVHFEDAVGVVYAAMPEQFAAHFAQDEVTALVRQMVGQAMASARHVERLWKADTDTVQTAEAEAFKGFWFGGEPAPAE